MATEFECDHCGSPATHFEPCAVYALDGAKFPCEPLTVYSRPAWCAQCNALVNAEYLPGADFYEQQLGAFQTKELSNSDREFIGMTNRTESQYRETVTNAWRIALSAVRDRESPSRCLSCGSTEIHHLDQYDPDSHELATFPHPNCDGSFVRTGSSFVNIDILYLDGEGRRMNGESTFT